MWYVMHAQGTYTGYEAVDDVRDGFVLLRGQPDHVEVPRGKFLGFARL